MTKYDRRRPQVSATVVKNSKHVEQGCYLLIFFAKFLYRISNWFTDTHAIFFVYVKSWK